MLEKSSKSLELLHRDAHGIARLDQPRCLKLRTWMIRQVDQVLNIAKGSLRMQPALKCHIYPSMWTQNPLKLFVLNGQTSHLRRHPLWEMLLLTQRSILGPARTARLQPGATMYRLKRGSTSHPQGTGPVQRWNRLERHTDMQRATSFHSEIKLKQTCEHRSLQPIRGQGKLQIHSNPH